MTEEENFLEDCYRKYYTSILNLCRREVNHNPLYADVIDAIKTGREPYVTARDGMRALETVLAIYKSAAEGRPVSLPLGECSTMDFCGRFDHIE